MRIHLKFKHEVVLSTSELEFNSDIAAALATNFNAAGRSKFTAGAREVLAILEAHASDSKQTVIAKCASAKRINFFGENGFDFGYAKGLTGIVFQKRPASAAVDDGHILLSISTKKETHEELFLTGVAEIALDNGRLVAEYSGRQRRNVDLLPIFERFLGRKTTEFKCVFLDR